MSDVIGYKSIGVLSDSAINTVYMWGKRGLLPEPKFFAYGRQPMFDREEVEQWLRDTGRHRDQKAQITEVE